MNQFCMRKREIRLIGIPVQKHCDDAGKARMETVPGKDYILLPLWTVDPPFSQINAVGRKASIELLDNLNMPTLEDIVYSDDDEDVGAEANMNNLDAFMPVSPILTTRVHKDHPVEQIIRDLNLAPQTRRMTKNLEEHVNAARHNLILLLKVNAARHNLLLLLKVNAARHNLLMLLKVNAARHKLTTAVES
ncbi:hypothetical protein Tco_1428911 [Tanacetum coccineum]